MSWLGVLGVIKRFWWAVPIALLLVSRCSLQDDLAASKAETVAERKAHNQTVANHVAAVEQARKDDAANAARVKAEQRAINQETVDDYQARLADARARYERLRQAASAAADPGRGGDASVPVLSAAASGAAAPAARDGLPAAPLDLELRLIATEQAIQLDALIDLVERQAGIDVNEGDVNGVQQNGQPDGR